MVVLVLNYYAVRGTRIVWDGNVYLMLITERNDGAAKWLGSNDPTDYEGWGGL